MINIDILMPNGVFFALDVDFNKPLDLLKQTLWEFARKYPLYSKLKGKDNYVFEYLNRSGEKEEAGDESLRLNQILPVARFLRLLERQAIGDAGNTTDKQIAALLGSKNFMELEAEGNEFRKNINNYCQSRLPAKIDFDYIFEKRYPLQLRCIDIPQKLIDSCINRELSIQVNNRELQIRLNFLVDLDDSPEMVVDKFLRSVHNHSIRKTYEYILKVVGKEEYFYGKSPLKQFKYIYSCLKAKKEPSFFLVRKNTVISMDNVKQKILPAPPPPPKIHEDVSVWEIHDFFEVKVEGVENIEVNTEAKYEIEKVRLFMGLYHGDEVLGDVNKVGDLPVSGGNCIMNRKLTFNLKVQDVQTASRLCIALHGKYKANKNYNPLAWVNIPVFDFKSRLLVGRKELPMWLVTEELRMNETGCHPLGTISPNYHSNIKITLLFSEYNRSPPIVFPTYDKISECAANNMEDYGVAGSPTWKPPKTLLEQLRSLIKNNTWDSLHEQERENIWFMRYEIRENYPDALPLVLKACKWNNHIDVAMMQVLLQTWKPIPVDSALELLDFNFPDQSVRKYAVDCLQDIEDDQLSLYLLQLVQALKYENYLWCPLALFLVERAQRNQHIGHQLFWLLKSELHDMSVSMRFGLLLEAYLRANPDHLSILYKEFEALNKLHAASQHVKNEKILDKKGKDEADGNLRMILQQPMYQEKLSELVSPLSPLYKLKHLSVSKCKCMGSKKRPLYLVWKNDEEDGHETHIIYKNGDDLRQDMLTLQMLQVMDSIWQAEGLDLRMNVYGCVATGKMQGMIEVVRNSETIASIQNGSPLDRKILFNWLKKKWKNNPAMLESAVEEFTLSCAGYTVATYVLGIGDRHNDNIMLKDTGQLFHIDFGHFLGNFKSKFGIKRERVPFVLTSHFAYIITNGDKNVENYERFEKYCLDAYLVLRRKAQLLIRLFMMMLSSGIPQLSSVSDLDYVKETLALKYNDKEACRQFKAKMTESLKAVSTKIMWYIHSKVH